jgi:hypothetical protein
MPRETIVVEIIVVAEHLKDDDIGGVDIDR